ncbi:MAG: hypothetical protein Q8L86_03090 [Vicinamibacterales bacterium]|nr:hypothetical protein [Vicinamibacterales bacterium]
MKPGNRGADVNDVRDSLQFLSEAFFAFSNADIRTELSPSQSVGLHHILSHLAMDLDDAQRIDKAEREPARAKAGAR